MIRIFLSLLALVLIIFFVKTHHMHHSGNLIKPFGGERDWTFENTGTAPAGAVTYDGNIARCDIIRIDKDAWHVQFYQRYAVLEDGYGYVLRFKAKASSNRTIHIASSTGVGDFHGTGLGQDTAMTSEWGTYEYKFKATATDRLPDRTPIFHLGGAVGTVWIKDIELEEAN